jgi:hypothetical protein
MAAVAAKQPPASEIGRFLGAKHQPALEVRRILAAKHESAADVKQALTRALAHGARALSGTDFVTATQEAPSEVKRALTEALAAARTQPAGEAKQMLSEALERGSVRVAPQDISS